MSRAIRVLLLCAMAAGAAVWIAACGEEKIKVASSNPDHAGAVLFNQRCAGCHTFAYAATLGSAANVRTAQPNNGPNFNVRCERPVARVLYAIENGGFSGAIMPQNVVVGQDAREVAQFVSKYAGSQAPKIVGQAPCSKQPVGSLPAPGQPATSAGAAAGQSSTARPGTQIPARGASRRQSLSNLRGPGGRSGPGAGRVRTVGKKKK
jgi:mono/diheme cytochrome c family protein